MTVIVVAPGRADSWQASNPAFRMIVDELRRTGPLGAVMPIVEQGQALGLVDLRRLSVTDQHDVALALAEAARRLRDDVRERGPADQWESELIEALTELHVWLATLADAWSPQG